MKKLIGSRERDGIDPVLTAWAKAKEPLTDYSSVGPDGRLMQIVRQERMIELYMETHNFWDLRRWKELDDMQNIYKVKVAKQTDGTIQYTKALHATYNIQDKMYFNPISNTELFKNHKLVQNTGW